MYNPNDPQRVYLDPHVPGTSYPFTYTPITGPSQVPQGPRPEGNVAYHPTALAPNLSTPLSASNSTTEYSNTQQVGASLASYKPGDAPAVGASVPASAAAPYINLMPPRPAPPSPAFEAQRMTAAGQAPSFTLFPGAQSVFSQPNTPLQGAQAPQVYQTPYLIQSRPQPQTYTAAAAAAPATGTPPATPQQLFFFPSAAQSAPVASFYPLSPTAAAPTTVVGGGGSAPHLAGSAAATAMGYAQPTPPAHPAAGAFTYVVDAQLLSLGMPPSYVRVASPPWSAATPLYSTASAATLPPREGPSLAAAATATAGPSAPPPRPVSAARPTPGRPATALRSEARPPPFSALAHHPTASTLVSAASTAGAAAGGSPEGIQPAALGVRNFSAPDPVGSCLLPNLPLDPIIPPLALPCPKWGKLPH